MLETIPAAYTTGQRVRVHGIGCGKVFKTRYDTRGELLYTIQLDSEELYYTREMELQSVAVARTMILDESLEYAFHPESIVAFHVNNLRASFAPAEVFNTRAYHDDERRCLVIEVSLP